jgi:hypothetical protein
MRGKIKSEKYLTEDADGPDYERLAANIQLGQTSS